MSDNAARTADLKKRRSALPARSCLAMSGHTVTGEEPRTSKLKNGGPRYPLRPSGQKVGRLTEHGQGSKDE